MRILLLLIFAVLFDVGATATCQSNNCVLPDCLCISDKPPNGGDGQQNPQIVLLSFQDAVTDEEFNNVYAPYLFDRYNPNGCTIGVTHFVTHPYSDYTKVHQLYADHGHEIAAYGISGTYRQSDSWRNISTDTYTKEYAGIRSILNEFGFIPPADVVGARVPDLQTGGDRYFTMLKDQGYLYDSTLSTQARTNPPLFPYTLDYQTTQDCPTPPCPTNSYPGLWEVPLVDYTDDRNQPCQVIDDCFVIPNTSIQAYNLILRNFMRHYANNRAPFGMFMTANWIKSSATNREGIMLFLDYLSALNDVYIINISDAIAWMKEPTETIDIENFTPWNCKSRKNTCIKQFTKKYDGAVLKEKSVVMTSCCPSPANYPWVDNPHGN